MPLTASSFGSPFVVVLLPLLFWAVWRVAVAFWMVSSVVLDGFFGCLFPVLLASSFAFLGSLARCGRVLDGFERGFGWFLWLSLSCAFGFFFFWGSFPLFGCFY
eukprot:941909_1